MKIQHKPGNRKSSPTKDETGCEEDFEETRPMDPDRTPNFK
jgi:hypothetical protein